jgi:hypothetical protein
LLRRAGVEKHHQLHSHHDSSCSAYAPVFLVGRIVERGKQVATSLNQQIVSSSSSSSSSSSPHRRVVYFEACDVSDDYQQVLGLKDKGLRSKWTQRPIFRVNCLCAPPNVPENKRWCNGKRQVEASKRSTPSNLPPNVFWYIIS